MSTQDTLCSLRCLPGAIEVIDQTLLPHRLRWRTLATEDDCAEAIRTMRVRGAPLIGITGAFGLAMALAGDSSDDALAAAHARLLATRPTAVNLRWALDAVRCAVDPLPAPQRAAAALAVARDLREQDIATCERIGEHGLALLEALPRGERLEIMTHCNAGWLATIEWGTALAPIYKAHAAGLPVHVWVSETRPRNQGMNLTAWELQRAGVPCTVVADNSCGQLLRTGRVDCVIVGSDRTAANGDVCNKVGTYLKALAANDNGVPFYVALPVSTIDWDCPDGSQVPIEERDADEVLTMAGLDATGAPGQLRIAPADTVAANPAFDITPARLVSRLVTEYGDVAASPAGLARLRQG